MAANEIKKVAAIKINRKRLVRIVNPPFFNVLVNEIDVGHLFSRIKQRLRVRLPGTFLAQFNFDNCCGYHLLCIPHSPLFILLCDFLHIRQAFLGCLNLCQVVYILQVFFPKAPLGIRNLPTCPVKYR